MNDTAAEPADKPPQAAATVLMVRDGSAGLEVFMVRRHERSNVLGGAWVFPGGKVDAVDADVAWRARLDLPLADLQARLGEDGLAPQDAAALHVAAAREVFEECGVLFVRPAGRPAALTATAPRDADFGALLDAQGVQLAVAALWPWSRWITPKQSLFITARRFDTRFFVAALPVGQQARHDAHEAVDGRWFTPRAALAQYWAGEIMLIPPQLMSLVDLATYADTDALLTAAAARRPHCVQPEMFECEGRRAMAYPGDPRHPQRERIMPGPLRLVQQGTRMEPPGGFEALFS